MAGEKYYPPRIEGTLPPFYKETAEKIIIKVPYEMNSTVGSNTFKGFWIKIKSVQNNELIHTVFTQDFDNNVATFVINDPVVIQNNFQVVGQFFKIQMAYDSAEVGYYSTVGVAKYTTKPIVAIDKLSTNKKTNALYEYTGTYKNDDKTEKVYSYNFTIYDQNNEVYETSGELLHNHENNIQSDLSYDTFLSQKTLIENETYQIVYTITTINGLVISSPKYKIVQQSTVPPEKHIDVIATMNEENAYVAISLLGENNQYGLEGVAAGNFLISRASSKDNYTTWMEIDRFALYDEYPSKYNWKDFTIEHGYSYKYSLQQYNDNNKIYSNRILSNEITTNFEHIYLYDGKRQIKIKYNPKISSFKDTLLESKTNTLGGKYPYFFRNGNVSYKEFPISGLISYQSDEEQLFLKDEDMGLQDISHLKRGNILDDSIDAKIISNKQDRTINLVDYNIRAERIFKLKVLEFLNDGKPKLFKSPGEGNYIVRLMNSSLSPNDQLGRMLHTFSTTATEIDTVNNSTLNKYNFISITKPKNKMFKWKTVIIDSIEDIKVNIETQIDIQDSIYSIDCEDMLPGDKIKIQYNAAGTTTEIQIGATGCYHIDFNTPPKAISISSQTLQGQITYKYYDAGFNYFDTYKSIESDDIPVLQLRQGEGKGKEFCEYFTELNDIKHQITKYYFLNFTKSDLKDEVELERLVKEGELTEQEKRDYYKFWLNDEEFFVTDGGGYRIENLDYIPKIEVGKGVCLDASIQRRLIEYEAEYKHYNLSKIYDGTTKHLDSLKSLCNNRKDIYIDYLRHGDAKDHSYSSEYANELKESYEDCYKAYIKELELALKAEEEKEGIV